MWSCVCVLLITNVKQGSDFLVTSSEPIPFKYQTIFIFRALSSIRSICRYYGWQVRDVRVLGVLFFRYDAVSMGNRIPTFRGNASSRIYTTTARRPLKTRSTRRGSVIPQKNGVSTTPLQYLHNYAYFIFPFWKHASGVLEERLSYVKDYGSGY